jgi:chromosome partitioning protein
MIILVGGIKGGTGKTTIATNLAVMFAIEVPKRVMLIDADEQASAFDWGLSRQQKISEFPSKNYVDVFVQKCRGRSLIQEIKQSVYKDIVIDCGGRDSEALRASMTIADLMIVPFRPGAFDVWALDHMGVLITAIAEINPKLKVLGVLNAADSRGSDNADAIRIANSIAGLTAADIMLGQRRAFKSATAEGLSVVEWKSLYRRRCNQSINEITNLFETLKSFRSN